MKRTVSLLILLALLSVLFTACVEKVEPTEPPTAAPTEKPEVTEEPPASEELGEVLKIGQLSMQSGVMALYGQQQNRGFLLGLEYMSGGEMDDEGRYIIANRPVEVLLRDTEGDPEKGVALARELIEAEGVELLQGPVSSAVAAALTTVALEN
ncbi:MAG: ABC transporter substrate-binding protein, partial [Anaerolineae bacterium]|nr:ABC transporter substrate-binding protein [Anaerolineae bacterium]